MAIALAIDNVLFEVRNFKNLGRLIVESMRVESNDCTQGSSGSTTYSPNAQTWKASSGSRRLMINSISEAQSVSKTLVSRPYISLDIT